MLTLAGRFAAADAAYETGHLSPAVRHAIDATCTPPFGSELASRAPALPPGARATRLIERVRAVAPLGQLGGHALVLVTVERLVGGTTSRGALELTLVELHGHWLVDTLSVLS